MTIRLRDLRDDDLPIFFEHQIDPVAIRMAAFTPRDRGSFMAHWKKILGDSTVTKRTIDVDGAPAGFVVTFDRNGLREIGYWIGSQFWGKGIASQALDEFLRHARERPLYGIVAEHNVASIRVLEKCGFAIVERRGTTSRTSEPEVEELIFRLDADEGRSRA